MDEFVHYHALGCAAFPLSAELNVFREACARQDLRLPLLPVFLPLRSYAYIGSLPVVPYLPFWVAFRVPVSARIQGAVFLLAAVALLARLARARPYVAVVALLLFPVVPFAFLVDTGPTGLSVLLFLWALVLVRAWVARDTPWRAAAAGACLFLGFFTKPVFVLFAPALLIFLIYELRGARAAPRRLGVVLLFACWALPSLLLLLSRDRAGTLYLRMIRAGSLSVSWASVAEVGRAMGGYLVCASEVVPRTLEIPSHLLDGLPALVALAVLVLGGTRARRSLPFVLMAVSTWLLTLLVGAASEVHHAAFALILLVLALASALESLPRAGIPVVAAFVVGFWASLALRLPSATTSPDTNLDKDRLLAFVRDTGLDSRTIQVHASWGTYYIAHLFGQGSQAVLYTDFPEQKSDVTGFVREAAQRKNRGILLISSRGKDPIPALSSAWGPPLATYTFGNWSAVEFLK